MPVSTEGEKTEEYKRIRKCMDCFLSFNDDDTVTITNEMIAVEGDGFYEILIGFIGRDKNRGLFMPHAAGEHRCGVCNRTDGRIMFANTDYHMGRVTRGFHGSSWTLIPYGTPLHPTCMGRYPTSTGRERTTSMGIGGYQECGENSSHDWEKKLSSEPVRL